MEPVMMIEDIMKILPHRYPFLLVDRVIEKNGTDSLVAIKNVTIKEPERTPIKIEMRKPLFGFLEEDNIGEN